MEQKPQHFDGSSSLSLEATKAMGKESFQMTDEMRLNIGRNPYSLDLNE